ncbi:MAG: YfhO family protein, partial [Lachnospiraceae bacterium]|nr:YfhO family protein [Lachnospiraceae bacterium]
MMLLIYSFIQGIYPAGRVTFLRKDLYHQYLPFLYELRRRLIEGKSLKYSFDLGLGSSFFAMYVYYLSDPLNFISVIIPERF